MKPQLLCTFTDEQSIFSCIKQIKKAYAHEGVEVDAYTTPTNIICVYNVVDRSRKIQDTISINKKKDTNTLYSINALNALIKAQNNGVLDKTFAINWHEYVDSLLLSNGDSYKCIKLVKINLV